MNPILTYTYREEFATEKVLTIAVVGAIGDEKGAKIIYEAAEQLGKRSLSARIVVIGITNLHNDFFICSNGKLEITGPYDNNDISQLLAKNEAGVVLIPSIWPETYSYTTAEAMTSGYPVIVFPLGAPAERIQRMGGGWIMKEVSTDALLMKIEELLDDRKKIVEQARVLRSSTLA